MNKRVLSFISLLTFVFSIVSCGKSSDKSEIAVTNTKTEESSTVELSYDEMSAAIYENELGEFSEAYQKVKYAKTVSERYALEAIAESKLMASAVMLPTQTKGGLYAISRLAPYTANFVLWGNDMERFHSVLVTTEPIKAADRSVMKAKWADLKGSGEYHSWAKSYLESKDYVLKDTYTIAYTTDPVTWDSVGTSRSADSEAIINTYDGLLEYDNEGTLQPAMAESYSVSDDGLKYTFKLRKGVTWVDSQGREVANFTADDFVSGMQHMMDVKAGLEYLIQGVIVNATEYIEGEVLDFSEVGVKALDDYTVEYTLNAPTSYFTTMLGYGVFAPMSRSYYESKGGKFGQEFDSSLPEYTYGKDTNSIAYCGPYVVSNATAKNTIVFKANESYCNADNINIKTITWLFNDGSDVTKAYTDMKDGTIDGANLNTSTLPIAKSDGLFKDLAYVSATDATSYMSFYNLNRTQFANINDDTTVVSTQSDSDKERANKALNNVHFRRALSFAVDRASYNAQQTGEDLKYNSLRNSYTPGNFVSLEEDVTVSINGKNRKFPAGTFYGEIMQAQMDADGITITVWDPKADDGIGSSDGFDGWYNPKNAVKELNVAIKELEAEGVTIDNDNPVYVDFPYPSNSEVYTNRANAYKQSLEASLDGLVIVNLVEAKSYEEWYYAGYYTDYGYETNFDIYDLSGWGPDFGDPSTYLDTFLADYAGYMIKSLGIY